MKAEIKEMVRLLKQEGQQFDDIVTTIMTEWALSRSEAAKYLGR